MASQCGPPGMSEDWTAVPAGHHTTTPQPPVHGWNGYGTPVSSHGLLTIDASATLDLPRFSVDIGSSPVLSYNSQSTHTLTLSAEPEPCMLPPNCGFPAVDGTSWTSPGLVVPSTSPVDGHVHSGYDLPAYGQDEMANACILSTQHALFPGAAPASALPPHDVWTQKRVTYTAPSQMRPILPRSDDSAIIGMAAQGSYPRLRSVQNFQETRTFEPNVSNVGTQPRITPRPVAPRPVCSANPTAVKNPNSTVSYNSHSLGMAGANMGLMYGSQTKAVSTYSPGLDKTTEDFSAFVQYDEEDRACSGVALKPGGHMLYGHSEQDHLGNNTAGHGQIRPASRGMVNPRLASFYQADNGDTTANQASNNASTVTSDSDEGRHRNHELYSRGPAEDGLYRCPHAGQSCQHKPTKLKCNYDKYIDSHLKPFRCKAVACAKQEFSSMACVLRHEREAHGMHGHGDRPHLCHYPECDRGKPGNGFPRSYNLRDHMKRVHDYKEEARALPAGLKPIQGSRTQKNSVERKRAAERVAEHERPTQRQRVGSGLHSPPQTGPIERVFADSTWYQESAHAQQSVYRAHEREILPTEPWQHHRENAAGQSGPAQRPGDIAEYYDLYQYGQDFRRLSG